MADRKSEEMSRAGLAAVADVARASIAGIVRKEHGRLAEISHIVSLAAERLEWLASDAPPSERAAIIAMLREAQNQADLAFLDKHGTEGDYQAIGKKVTARFRTPGGKWRRA